MANEEYRVERPLLTTRVFHGGQGRLDPASDLPSAVDPAGVYQRWRESVGSDVDDAEVELVSGLFTDEVQGPLGGPLTFERRAAWVVFGAYTVDRWPGRGHPPRTQSRYRVERASVYDAHTGEYLSGYMSATPLV
ncbi:MAG: hypothetical protein E6J50_08655 [Chloroflexi bacterium]|nr:MAG: hypothetical protein E6J50_08655 [Chloroflexota bacterium]